ncbi:MAG: serine hydrolase [Candidatus Paceibacterota bacterium]
MKIPNITLSDEQIKSLGGVLLPLAILSVIPFSPATKTEQVAVTEPESVLESEEVILEDPFNSISIQATSAYVFDTVTGEVLFELNPDTQLPLASVTKLMTAYAFKDYFEKANTITISRESLLEEGDSGLYLNESWRPRDLLDFTLMVSSNDGAHAIASAVNALLPSQNEVENSTASTTEILTPETFIDVMNRKAKELGLSTTYFLNESGLDVSESQSGAYGSARDMAHLISIIYQEHPELLEATRYSQLTFSSLNELEHEASNTNATLNKLPNVLGSKTGYTELAGGNLVVLIDAGINHPIAIAVLGSTFEGRFDDIEQLSWASLKKITQ